MITFIGGGNMASALIGALLAGGATPESFRVVEPIAEQRLRLVARFGAVAISASAQAADIEGVDVVVFAVKPQQMRQAAQSVASLIREAGVVLTIAAGIRTADLSRWLGGYTRIVRAMPNTPALVGAGISGVYVAPGTPLSSAARAIAVVEAGGRVVRCEREDELDAVTGVSGSGPAYVFYFLEALEQAARELGFDAARARELAYATFEGSIALARKSSESPAQLRASVTSKGGTTACAIESLDQAHVSQAFIAAIKAATRRAGELGDEFGRGS